MLRLRLGGRQLAFASIFLAFFMFFIFLWSADLSPSAFVISRDYDSCDSGSEDSEFTDHWSAGSIFFHETTCRRREERHLSPRQACAVESAALANPDWKIQVLFSSPQNYSDVLFSVLTDYSNVLFRHLQLRKYAKGTPLEKWVETGKLEASNFKVSHTSDVLRMLTLWKYGGVYMDLDVVVARPLKDLGMNWAGFESSDVAGSSVLAFSRDELGRRFTDAALREIITNFRGDIWGHNGPHLIDRVMKRMCRDHHYPKSTEEDRCQGFRMYPPDYFYPIPYTDWKLYFTPDYVNELKKLENITYLYHVWNKLSSEIKINSTIFTPYAYLAEKYCPKVYALTKDNFYAVKH